MAPATAQTMPTVEDCEGIQSGGTVIICTYDRQTGKTTCVQAVCP